MRWVSPHPCIGVSESVLRMSRSSVPCRTCSLLAGLATGFLLNDGRKVASLLPNVNRTQDRASAQAGGTFWRIEYGRTRRRSTILETTRLVARSLASRAETLAGGVEAHQLIVPHSRFAVHPLTPLRGNHHA